MCSVIVLCGMMMKERENVKPGADSQHAPLEKHQGTAWLNVLIRRTNRYQQYYMPSQHTYCGGIWNLIQDCDVQSSDQKVYISTPPSPEVENFQLKNYYPAGDRTPELLNQRLPREPARRACHNFVIYQCLSYTKIMHVDYLRLQ